MKNDFDDKIWQIGGKVISTLQSHGFDAYFVGGCVRDSLLKRKVKDIDIATSALPSEVMNVFDKTVPTGIEHGTVLVLLEGESYEVTTFRRETSYSDRRHPDAVDFIRNLEEDLKRRDFTINAMAMDASFQVIDLYGGRNDLENKIIKTVGNASKRFEEDALRMLRALRFSSQLGFTIEDETFKSIQSLSETIAFVAIERIKVETEKLLSGESILSTLDLLIQSTLPNYFPILKENPTLKKNSFLEIKAPLLNFSVLIALMHLNEQSISVQKWGRAWKCSNDEIKSAQTIVNSFHLFESEGLTAWFVFQTLSIEKSFHNFLQVKGLYTKGFVIKYNQHKTSLTIKSRKELSISGHDVIKLFPKKKSGQWIRDIINSVEKEVVIGNLSNENDKIKEWIKCHPLVKD